MPSDSFEAFIESVHEKVNPLLEERKLPKKYKKGLNKEEEKIMKKEVKETSKMDEDDPKAYEEWESDKKYKARGNKPKKSKHTSEYEKRFGKKESVEDESLLESEVLLENSKKALKNKSEESGIAYGILKDVFDRGMAAWRTGHRPGVSPNQWAMGRVNSFITGGKTRTTTDKDLWEKHKKNKKKKKD